MRFGKTQGGYDDGGPRTNRLDQDGRDLGREQWKIIKLSLACELKHRSSMVAQDKRFAW